MKYGWHAAAFAVLLTIANVVLFVATRDGAATQQSVTRVAEPDEVIGQDLMMALAQAKNFHHKAKVYMTDGNLAEATAAVRQILSLRFPPNTPEADDVRNDARAMLAKLLVAQNQLEEAMRTVNEGIAQSTRESFFVANLYTVQGEVHEARALQLDTANEKAKAADARRSAIGAYDKSIKINEALQKKMMEGKRGASRSDCSSRSRSGHARVPARRSLLTATTC
jgi:tetratricopeptide (TPR) repeat protein